jgi:hypothetical protein
VTPSGDVVVCYSYADSPSGRPACPLQSRDGSPLDPFRPSAVAAHRHAAPDRGVRPLGPCSDVRPILAGRVAPDHDRRAHAGRRSGCPTVAGRTLKPARSRRQRGGSSLSLGGGVSSIRTQRARGPSAALVGGVIGDSRAAMAPGHLRSTRVGGLRSAAYGADRPPRATSTPPRGLADRRRPRVGEDVRRRIRRACADSRLPSVYGRRPPAPWRRSHGRNCRPS